MQRIGAEPAWSMGTGNGVVIAVVDTGVDLAHEDLAVPGKLVQGHDFEDRDSNPQDQHGHGTHVAGIAAAATNNGKGVAGTAPSAKIMSVRVLNALGVGVSITLIERQRAAEGIRWAVDHGASVVNLSLGPIAGQGPGSDMAEAIAYAWS
ncbi:MAG: S8 family serine peptidase, partial [Actinomycetota bacterium]